MLLACSHVVLASADVPKIARFFSAAFTITPRFSNDMFVEFVLPSGFRIAFFTPVGATAKTFSTTRDRDAIAIGVTVDDVDAVHAAAADLGGATLSGPPKDHPWGERSFLMTDPDGNRWEVTQSPTDSGMLIER